MPMTPDQVRNLVKAHDGTFIDGTFIISIDVAGRRISLAHVRPHAAVRVFENIRQDLKPLVRPCDCGHPGGVCEKEFDLPKADSLASKEQA